MHIERPDVHFCTIIFSSLNVTATGTAGSSYLYRHPLPVLLMDTA